MRWSIRSARSGADGSVSFEAEDLAILESTGDAKTVVAMNKSDLKSGKPRQEKLVAQSKQVRVSALTGAGLDDLTAAILEPFRRSRFRRGWFIDHGQSSLRSTAAQPGIVVAGLKDARGKSSGEIVLVGLHNALRYLGEITGETADDEILGEIFSTFLHR